MADTPDIGRIIGLIMENPSLIAEISALAKRETGDTADKEPAPPAPEATQPASAPVETAPASAQESPAKLNRHRLLSAMKPYLSEGRCRAIDQMTSLGEILEAMKRR